MNSAADRWRQALEAWAIPQSLLDAAEGSPYGWPAPTWKRRAEIAIDSKQATPTSARVTAIAGPRGTVLDIGAGTGRASLPLAQAGHRVTAVEPAPGMLAGLHDLGRGLPVSVIEGRWPEVARQVRVHDVGMCAHVVYDVADVGPFVEALAKKARRGVVIEMTETHPWTHLGRYYQALHSLDRPDGPTSSDLAAVVEEVLGVVPTIERWRSRSDLWFESVDDIVELYGRRLVLPRHRYGELIELLTPELTGEPGHWQVGKPDRMFVTLWWKAASKVGR
ncbi:MAG: class I SAM-dependent methyltransferase [Actinomycetota bacterium]